MWPSAKRQLVRPHGRGSEAVEVDENLSSLERGCQFGKSKLSLQRLVFVGELVDCAHEIGYEAAVSFLLPLVRQLASDPEVLVRQSLVDKFGDLAGFLIQSDPERGYQKVVDDLLPIVSLLLTEKASEVRQGAADALTTLASHLRPGERGDQVLMTVISLSHSNDDEDARTIGVQLLNSLAETLGVELCSQFVGIELIALCQDPSVRVRKAAAANFAELCRVVSSEYVLRRLVPAYARLVGDAHSGVRKAAAESLIGIAMALPAEGRAESFVPLMTSLLNDSSRWVRVAALQQLGYLIGALEQADRVPRSLLNQYVEIIEQAKANPDAQFSYHCGFTFAAVTKAMGADWWPMLQAPFVSLCSDKQAPTRKVMAASMHIVAQAVSPSSLEEHVLPQFELLLQDQDQDARHAALKNASNLIRVAPGSEQRKRLLNAVHSAMTKADTWRLRRLIASQLGPLCDALTAASASLQAHTAHPKSAGDSVAPQAAQNVAQPRDTGGSPGTREDGANNVEEAPAASATGASDNRPDKAESEELAWTVIVPLFRQLCTDGVAEVRDEAARSTSHVLKAAAPEMFEDPAKPQATSSEGCSGGMARQPQKPESARLLRHLIATFAKGKSFRFRMAYIRMCDSVIRDSPPHVFTGFLMRPLLRLTKDDVKNVRLCWATTMLPHIRQAGRFRQHQGLVVAAIRMQKAAKDKDTEVFNVLSLAKLSEVEISGEADLSSLGDSESDMGEGWREGGTGDSSECSDVGVAEDEETDRQEAPSPPIAGGATSPPPASNPGSASSSKLLPAAAVQPPPAGPALNEPTGEGATVLEVCLSPKASPSSPPKGRSPRSSIPSGAHSPPTSPPAPALAHDPVEDELVAQCELEHNMDNLFADRRLLAEAGEGTAQKNSGGSPLERLTSPMRSDPLAALASIAGDGAAKVAKATSSAVDTVVAKTAGVAAASVAAPAATTNTAPAASVAHVPAATGPDKATSTVAAGSTLAASASSSAADPVAAAPPTPDASAPAVPSPAQDVAAAGASDATDAADAADAIDATDATDAANAADVTDPAQGGDTGSEPHHADAAGADSGTLQAD